MYTKEESTCVFGNLMQMPWILIVEHSCIDELCKCGGFITLLGQKYGGEYNGSQYKQFAEEIKEKSRGRIEKPSITLMEYYAGRRDSHSC